MNRIRKFPLIAICIVVLGAVVATTLLIRLDLFKAKAAVNGPQLSVNAALDRHAISPDIYGMNTYGVDAAFAQELHIPVERWGGDATSRYNWQTDTSNAGFDWYFMGGGKTNPTPSGDADAFIQKTISAGGKAVLTVPLMNYIDKGGDANCSFPVSKYGQQQSTNPYVHPNGDSCGNSLKPDGSQIQDTNIAWNNVANSPAYQQQWVQHLLKTFGSAANGGVNIYQMDNEPSGWGNTHRDIHPGSTGYDELVNKTYQYAAMIKSVDSSANILGPSDFGYPAYIGMGSSGDNASSHGVGFAEYYLQKMHQYEQQHGVRLLNYFDEHYYPAEAGVPNSPAGDANTQALRLRSTRSLWDPTYKDESWIGQWYPPIQLLRTFHNWVNKDYPGTKIAITEYNFGGVESMNGALAEADVLGIFGREQLDLATMWGPPSAQQPAAYAFRMYLNYDGKGSKYGDVWVQSQSTDQGQLAVYGSQRSSDGALTLMVVNKTGGDLSSNLALSGFASAGKAQVYSYSGANLTSIVRKPDLAVDSAGFTTTYPANSITLIVLPKSGSAVSAPTSTPTATSTQTAVPTPTPTHVPVVLPPVPPPFTNKGVSPSYNHALGNFDGVGTSYPAELLNAIGFTSGATIKHAGMNFTWPLIADGSYDNWIASGQTIPVQKQGQKLGFLGAATSGPSTGTVIVTYKDGTTQRVQLTFSDWTLSANKVQPVAGNEVVAKLAYRDTRKGTEADRPCIFFTSIPLDPTKTVQSITLPVKASQGFLHVFAIAVA